MPDEPLQGLHHVSAVTGQASANVRFYTQVLGLRLVTKTVNQDDPRRTTSSTAARPGRPART